MQNHPLPPEKKPSKEMLKLVVENNFEYVRMKAFMVLDAISQDSDFRKEILIQSNERINEASLLSGLKQMIDYKGLTANKSLTGLEIPGFYYLMFLFHFHLVRQEIAVQVEGFIIDRMIMAHDVLGYQITLYN